MGITSGPRSWPAPRADERVVPRPLAPRPRLASGDLVGSPPHRDLRLLVALLAGLAITVLLTTVALRAGIGDTTQHRPPANIRIPRGPAGGTTP
jgi:hypothetical protein